MQVYSKNLRNPKTLRYQKNIYNYRIMAQNLPMLKQGVKKLTLNLFEHVHYPNFFFVHFRPYTTSFPGLLLSLTLMSKRKKTLETSLDLTPSLKTSVDTKVEGLVLNVDYLENRRHNFIQKKYGRKRHLRCTHSSFSGM